MQGIDEVCHLRSFVLIKNLRYYWLGVILLISFFSQFVFVDWSFFLAFKFAYFALECLCKREPLGLAGLIKRNIQSNSSLMNYCFRYYGLALIRVRDIHRFLLSLIFLFLLSLSFLFFVLYSIELTLSWFLLPAFILFIDLACKVTAGLSGLRLFMNLLFNLFLNLNFTDLHWHFGLGFVIDISIVMVELIAFSCVFWTLC